MRPPVPEHKQVYVRFHKQIDACLTEFARKTGMKRATAVMWLQKRYMERLFADGKQLETVTIADLHLTGMEELYFITLGRGTEGSMLGRGMQLTVDKGEERKIQLLAMQIGLSVRDFRTVILVQSFQEIGLL